jgi:hypothetical protein
VPGLREELTHITGDVIQFCRVLGSGGPKTVANVHSLIKEKLGVASDIELVRLALRQGILNQICPSG